jgi:hypothetical protein
MLNKAQIVGVAGLWALVLCGCGGSSGEAAKTVTFHVPGMGEKLKLL